MGTKLSSHVMKLLIDLQDLLAIDETGIRDTEVT